MRGVRPDRARASESCFGGLGYVLYSLEVESPLSSNHSSALSVKKFT